MKVDLIGHSLGGIVILSAVNQLRKNTKIIFNTLVTIQSPLLGAKSNNALLNVGFNVFKQWKASVSTE